MKKIKKILLILILFLAMLNFSGCGKDNNNELKDKVISELGYVNIKILDMLNLLNNISFENYTIISKEVKLDKESQKGQSKEESNDKSEGQALESNQSENQKQESESQDLINTTEMISNSILAKNRNDIDWNIIKPEIELLNQSWSIIVIDLYSLNVKSDTILDFSSKIDLAMIAIKNEDKQAGLNALANMYASLPIFLEEIDANKNLQKIRQTQSYTINAYILADDMSNNQINNNLQKAVDIYSEIVGDIDYAKDKSYKTNKVYVLLNELINSIRTGDPDVFYVKYKNFMESINEL